MKHGIDDVTCEDLYSDDVINSAYVRTALMTSHVRIYVLKTSLVRIYILIKYRVDDVTYEDLYSSDVLTALMTSHVRIYILLTYVRH